MLRGILIVVAWLLVVTLVLPQLLPAADNRGHPPMYHR